MSLNSFNDSDRALLVSCCAVYVAEAAAKFGCDAAQVYGTRGSRHGAKKSKAIVAARRQVAGKLRMLKMTPYGPYGLSAYGRALSTPVIAELLRLKNHTTIVNMLKKQETT